MNYITDNGTILNEQTILDSIAAYCKCLNCDRNSQETMFQFTVARESEIGGNGEIDKSPEFATVSITITRREG